MDTIFQQLKHENNDQGSHGHEISGKVLKLENTISSTGNVLE